MRIMRGGKGSRCFISMAAVVPGWALFFNKPPTISKSSSPNIRLRRHRLSARLDNIHDLAYFYLDFIRHFRLSGVNLAGISLGAWLGCEIAVRDQVRSRVHPDGGARHSREAGA